MLMRWSEYGVHCVAEHLKLEFLRYEKLLLKTHFYAHTADELVQPFN